MLINKQDVIQKESRAVLNVFQETNTISVFGKSENVSEAKNMIETLVKERCDMYLDVRTRGGESPIQCTSVGHSGHFLNEPDEVSDPLNNNNISDHTTSHDDVDFGLQTDCAPATPESDISVDVTKKLLARTQAVLNLDKIEGQSVDFQSYGDGADMVLLSPENELQMTGLNLADTASLQSSCEHPPLSKEDVLEYDSKVEFAVKLGYSENQLRAVIQKLGTNASQNEILSELIKVGKSPKTVDDNALSSSEDEQIRFSGGMAPSFFRVDTDQRVQGESTDNYRPVVIDGSNVAMSHGNKEIFSCRGIQLAVEWFKQRGHQDITVFVPQWRKETSRPDAKIKDQDILTQLEKRKVLVFTPARRIGGKRVVCYDDRYILKLAAETGGIVVSNDNYRDLLNESPEYRKVVEERLLMYSFVNDRFMPPDDPLGRHGPSLDNFLSHEPLIPEPLPPLCPYGSKKCTYGNKCKFYHPERGNIPQKSVTEKLAEQAKQKMQEVKDRGSLPLEGEKKPLLRKKNSLLRTKSLAQSVSDTSKEERLKANRLSADFGALAADDPQTSIQREDTTTVEKREKWKSYDDKLTLCRKKMEQAEQEENEDNKQPGQSVEESAVLSFKSTKSEDFALSSMSANEVKSRSSSPHQNRGSSSPQVKPQEQFLSGHLLLAKKLSDEAAEKKIRHKAGADRDSSKTPPLDQNQLGLQHHYRCNSPLAQPNTHTGQQAQVPSNTHTQVKQTSQSLGFHDINESALFQSQSKCQKQKLSRQLSLQGANDPRIRAGNLQQISQNPRSMQNQISSVARPRPLHASRSVGLPCSQEKRIYEQTDPFSSNSLGMAQSHQNLFSQQFQQQTPNHYGGPSVYNRISEEHASLARMQSAPEMPMYNNNIRTSSNGRMVRQNSSSDTQLHLLGTDEPVDFVLNDLRAGGSGLHYSENYSGYTTRGLREHAALNHQRHPVLGQSSSIPSQQMHQGFFQHSQPPPPQKHQVGNTTWTFGNPNLRQEQTKHQWHKNYPPFFPPQHQHHHHHQHQQQQQQQQHHTHSAPFRDSNHSQFDMSEDHDKGMLMHTVSPTSFLPQQSYPSPDVPLNSQQRGCDQNQNRMGQQQANQIKQCKDDAPIHPTDPRYNLYYHLCGLFPESKVREVMNRHPDEKDPQELCAYIIGAK